jgi:dTDP-4-dehydrorhamnose 3,5-epimerase
VSRSIEDAARSAASTSRPRRTKRRSSSDCTRGAIFDVVADLRPGSETYGRWDGIELTEDEGRAIYIPEGCAHGFQTLVDDTEIAYQISVSYVPRAARGIRWNDPTLAILWPISEKLMSERDCQLPLLTG